MTSTDLQNQINSLPENLRKELEDFVKTLVQKAQSKKILKKDLNGVLKGKIKMSDDFDEPLEDFKEYME